MEKPADARRAENAPFDSAQSVIEKPRHQGERYRYLLAGAASLATMASIACVCLVVVIVEPRVLLSMGLLALGAALDFYLCRVIAGFATLLLIR